MYKHLQESHPGKEPEEVKFGMTVLRQHFTAFSRMVYEEILIYLAGDKTLNSKSMYNRCKIPRLSVMVGEEEVEPVKRTEYDTRELESEIAQLRTRQRQRREDSEENPRQTREREDGISTISGKERGWKKMRLRNLRPIKRMMRVTL